MRVGDDVSGGRNVTVNELFGLTDPESSRQHAHHNVALALDGSDHRSLAAERALFLVLVSIGVLTADVGFVDFNEPLERRVE